CDGAQPDETDQSRPRNVQDVRGEAAEVLGRRVRGAVHSALVPAALHSAVNDVLALIADMTAKIKSYDSTIAAMIKRYPAAQLVGQITGVGPLTSLAYVLTVEDPHRIVRSRSAGAYFGLVPGSDDAGEKHQHRRIT